MRSNFEQRSGFALPVALMAIVVIGALIAGAFFSSTQELRVGRNSIAEQRAFAAAENGLGDVASDINASYITNTLQVGVPVTRTVTFTDSTGGTTNTATNTIRITKLSSQLVLITSLGNLASGAATRQTSMILRAAIPTFSMPGALTVNGSLTIGGASQINGNDSPPPSWDESACPADDGGKAGIATQPGVTIKISGSGCEDLNCVTADPKQLETTTAADTSTYFVWGNTNWTELVSQATISLPGGKWKPEPTTTTVDDIVYCRAGDLNWGEPNHDAAAAGVVPQCMDRYPIIYLSSTTTLNAGSKGQGILLVNGDLNLSGGFEFAGPIIIRGDLKTTGTNVIRGSVSAANVDLDKESSIALGSPTINYSNCAIQTAISGGVKPKPIKNRSWVEMFQ